VKADEISQLTFDLGCFQGNVQGGILWRCFHQQFEIVVDLQRISF
jgi:hypothetical protein